MTHMTVVQLLPDLNVGGVERGTLEIASALVRGGHRAIVISNYGPMVEELQASGAQHIALPIGRKSLMTLRYIRRLRRIFIEHGVDIVHARSRLPAWIGTLALKGMHAAQRPRWVTTVHGPYSVNRYSEIMVSGDKIIAISEFIRRYIVDNYPHVNKDKIRVIHRGVDTAQYNQQFKPSEAWLDGFQGQHFYAPDKKILVFPGRLTRWKGQMDFINLMTRLRDSGQHVIGLIIGAQSDKKSAFEQELRQLVQRNALENTVFFLGQRNDLKELFAIADISYSLPNVPEAFGRTTLEALSLGTPVIGYDEGGTGEILQDIFPSGLVAKGNLDEVAAKTVSFLQAPPPVPPNSRMTTANLQTSTLAVYQALLNGGGET